MGLEYKDVKDWKPAGISIVDSPSHPLAIFEVYPDNEAFIKKYKKDDNMSENIESNNKVEVSEGFLERFLKGFITKSETKPEPPVEPVESDNLKEVISQMNEKLNKMDERISKLENTEEESEDKADEGDATPGAITKNESDNAGDSVNSDGTINTDEVITKSQSIDPDLVRSEPPKESFMKRLGRDENGMKIKQ